MHTNKVYQIYKTNCFEKGLGIQASRFNHSCSANAEATFDDKNEIREIRAVSNIKAGEEICINYEWIELSMKNFQKRHSN